MCDLCKEMEFVMVSSGRGWDAPVRRGTKHHFCNKLSIFHNNEWLQMQRSVDTGIEETRKSLIAGGGDTGSIWGAHSNVGNTALFWPSNVSGSTPRTPYGIIHFQSAPR